jgi:hypothetical protein
MCRDRSDPSAVDDGRFQVPCTSTKPKARIGEKEELSLMCVTLPFISHTTGRYLLKAQLTPAIQKACGKKRFKPGYNGCGRSGRLGEGCLRS